MATKTTSSGSKRKAAPTGKGASASSAKKARLNAPKKTKKVEVSGNSDDTSGDDLDDLNEGDEEFEGLDDSDSEDGGAPVKQSAPRKDSKKANKKQADGKEVVKGPDSSKEAHALQKKLAKERKAAKPLGDEVQRTKKIWERLRRKSHVPSDERKQLVEELFSIITGRVKDFVLKHDAVRVVQTAIKYSNTAQRKQITQELQGNFSQLAESRYAKFLIAKLVVQKEAEIRDMIIPDLYGRVRRLINHPEASWILDDIYRQVATKEQKAILLREWYGPEFALLERSKDETPTADLASIIEAAPSKRGPIMKSLLHMINSLVQKQMTGFTMLHDAMLQCFLNLKPESDEYTGFVNMIKDDETGDLLKNMAFTRSGARLVCLLLAHGSSKDRRNILKAFKDHFILMSGDAFAHMVILTAYDVIDDTKMTSKVILSELVGDDEEKAAENIMAATTNQYARTALMYPLEGQSKALFLPNMNDDRQILAEVHEIRKTTSKKDSDLRSAELAAALSPSLLNTIASSAPLLMADSFGCHLVAEVLLSVKGDKQNALEAVAAVAEGDPNAEVAEVPALDGTVPSAHVSQTPWGGRTLKTLIAGGKFNKTTGKVEQVEPPLAFANTLYPVLKDHIVAWATGPSSLVVLALLESADFSHGDEVKAILKKNIKALKMAATEETPEQKAKQEAEEQDVGEKAAKKGKKGKKGASKPDRPVGNAGSRLLLERL
ncbi:PUF6 protein [Sodiomyces alkalinus F11]|uniref:PUF6 protein n=1 Tax=Sodiomyces alkalinus (strain CBS 110278 / VKM F-3762 / F11) TaxID=1314773 RepID=A0A3N2PR61_SODAK|nr:PUF6 protein [Sodiomyces alkalinus F11]ROT36993.1 PUF6 protein [Sodiomyces alkalinus F11]